MDLRGDPDHFGAFVHLALANLKAEGSILSAYFYPIRRRRAIGAYEPAFN
jgi:hypothetical protein